MQVTAHGVCLLFITTKAAGEPSRKLLTGPAPSATTTYKIQRLILEAGREPIERDALYRRIVRDPAQPAKWSVGEELLVQSSSRVVAPRRGRSAQA